MTRALVAVVLVAVAAVASLVAADPCAQYLSCQTCLAAPVQCGWCSVRVVFASGAQGPQCTGIPGAQPFTCPAIFSDDEVCIQGYICDTASGTCRLAPPGQGTSKAQCEKACVPVSPSPHAQVYCCDAIAKTCSPCASGTPGSASYEICMAQCRHVPTPAPGPVAPVYACNATTWQCQRVPAGTPNSASLQVCESWCNESSSAFTCNYATGACDRAAPGSGGVPLAVCRRICQNVTNTPSPTRPPAPGPPPEYIGVWRGVEIQNNYAVGEWDMSVNATTVVLVRVHQSGNVVQVGVPYHIVNSPDLEFWILITSGPGAGSYLRSIGDTSGERGPQTKFATMALSRAGGAAPTSIAAAMINGVDRVLAWTRCIPGEPYCHFALPGVGAAEAAAQAAAAARAKRVQEKRVELAHKQQQQQQRKKNHETVGAAYTDYCSKFGETCSVCTANSGCGWCSTDVEYSDGSVGTQCAGFVGNHTRWTCAGRFSTDGCEVGYNCESGSFTCTPTVPGDGMPQAVCLATCKPTPPPNPTVPQYTCDLVTKQCIHCTSDHCPGSMPLGQCEQLCPHPMPGPTPAMTGIWRGIYIQQRYPNGEVDLVLNATGAFMYVDGAPLFTASVVSLGADVMLWTIETGAPSLVGKTIGVLYQMATTFYGLYWQGTFVLGLPDHGFPDGYEHGMYVPGMKELVLAKCLESPCAFHAP
jgi:hypothetical protein